MDYRDGGSKVLRGSQCQRWIEDFFEHDTASHFLKCHKCLPVITVQLCCVLPRLLDGACRRRRDKRWGGRSRRLLLFRLTPNQFRRPALLLDTDAFPFALGGLLRASLLRFALAAQGLGAALILLPRLLPRDAFAHG